jgi:hypothetical protein
MGISEGGGVDSPCTGSLTVVFEYACHDRVFVIPSKPDYKGSSSSAVSNTNHFHLGASISLAGVMLDRNNVVVLRAVVWDLGGVGSIPMTMVSLKYHARPLS